jgi:hypothetical protein
LVFKNTLTIIGDMGLLYKITKWGVNRLIKQGVDLSNLVDVDKTTKLLREASLSLNNDLVNIQDQFCVKRSEIIKAQNELIVSVEPLYLTFLAESKDASVQTTMTKHWLDHLDNINTLIDEHEELISKFDEKHNQLKAIETKLN